MSPSSDSRSLGSFLLACVAVVASLIAIRQMGARMEVIPVWMPIAIALVQGLWLLREAVRTHPARRMARLAIAAGVMAGSTCWLAFS